MNNQLNKNLGNWLTKLNGKTVEKIFQVDLNNERQGDGYLPWIYFVTFIDLDKFLELEGDFDGDHIKVNLYDFSELDQKIKENHMPDEPDLWSVYETSKDETLGKLLGQRIEYLEYGIDKDEFEINGTKINGQKDLFNFIAFYCNNIKITIFESTGLGVSDDPKIKLMFEETFDRYDTK